MAANNKQPEPDHRHHLSVFWGNRLLATAVFLAAMLPAVILLVLGYGPGWAAGAMVAGFVAVWGISILYFMTSARRRNPDIAATSSAANS